jgi:hypothetical protein
MLARFIFHACLISLMAAAIFDFAAGFSPIDALRGAQRAHAQPAAVCFSRCRRFRHTTLSFSRYAAIRFTPFR